jgi:hypothetical protein
MIGCMLDGERAALSRIKAGDFFGFTPQETQVVNLQFGLATKLYALGR